MAYCIKNADMVVADTADDIANIPTNLTNIGAIAVVADGGAQYILAPSRTWVEFSTGGGGGGGGSGGGALVVDYDLDTGLLNKTWQEIHDAAPLVWVVMDGAYSPLVGAFSSEGSFGVAVWNYDFSEVILFSTTSADGYPARSNT